MTEDRVFDAAALEEYRLFLQELVDELENDVIPVLATGALSKAPAFGSAPGAAENAFPEYAEFHASTWRNLQYLRGSLHGMRASLGEAAEGTGGADRQVFWDFSAIEDAGGPAQDEQDA